MPWYTLQAQIALCMCRCSLHSCCLVAVAQQPYYALQGEADLLHVRAQLQYMLTWEVSNRRCIPCRWRSFSYRYSCSLKGSCC